jgi:site-specific recombinase XerD
MRTHNAQNERIKREYFTYLIEAKGFSEATLDGVAKALNRLKAWSQNRDHSSARQIRAAGFQPAV